MLIDKPAGMTSHDAVSKVRRAARTRRVGHAGTLDPFATGLLIVCVESATRLVQFLVGLDKEYIATVRLGFATDTQDLTGKQITPLVTSNQLSEDDLKEILTAMTGPQLQLPPMYSAKKVGGERLHKAARAGREVEREMVEITVHSIELLSSDGHWMRKGDDGTCNFDIRVRCSSGTYVRTLAHDLGTKLSTGGHLSALRRTGIGGFGIASAVSLDEVEVKGEESSLSDIMLTMSETVSHLRMIEIDREQVRLAMVGREIQVSEGDLYNTCDRAIRLCDTKGELIAIGEPDLLRKVVKPRVVFKAQG